MNAAIKVWFTYTEKVTFVMHHCITHKWSDELNVFLFVMLCVRAIQSYCYIFFHLIWSQTSGDGIELFLCTGVEAALRMSLCSVTQNNYSLALTLNTLKNTHKKRRAVVWKQFFSFSLFYTYSDLEISTLYFFILRKNPVHYIVKVIF